MNKKEIREHLVALKPFLLPHQRDITICYCNTCDMPIEPEMFTVDVDTLTRTCLYCGNGDISRLSVYYHDEPKRETLPNNQKQSKRVPLVVSIGSLSDNITVVEPDVNGNITCPFCGNVSHQSQMHICYAKQK